SLLSLGQARSPMLGLSPVAAAAAAVPWPGAEAVGQCPEQPGLSRAVGPEPAGLGWGEALGAAQSSGQLAELAGSWAGLREPGPETISVHLSLAERAGAKQSSPGSASSL
ncbi:unnamed protein product, partial [Coccothraustes coccothraustes]